MRVISGFLRSRQLKYDIKGTRPTMDKIKESLFAIIQNSVKDSVCLDLFAGSGSLGIEAISNGASLVYFIDSNPIAIKIINQNVTTFGIKDKSNVILNDYKKALDYFNKNSIKFDLIFLDPPYDMKIIESILAFIDSNKLLKANGQVICEYEKDTLLDQYGNLFCIKNRDYGSKKIMIYCNKIST